MDDTTLKSRRPKTGGRKKGTPNKTTAAVKEAILHAFDEVGGASYLASIARDDPRTFCTLLGRILPSETGATVNSTITIEEFVANKAREREEAKLAGQP
jgi:hypothetical protein